MDEAQRFLRYVTPGLMFVILTVFYLLFLSQEQWDWNAIQNRLPKENLSAVIGAVAGLILTSGGVGFLLSTVHHALFWNLYGSFALDYRRMLQDAVDARNLELRFQGQPLNDIAEELSRAGSWQVISSIWHERRETSNPIKGTDRRTVTLSDIMHGAGTAFVASVMAVLLWWCIYYKICQVHPDWYLWILPLGVAVVEFCNFCQTVRHCQGVVSIVLANELSRESIKNGPPVVILNKEALRFCYRHKVTDSTSQRETSKT